MANITTELATIRNAQYGNEVRNAIRDALTKINTELAKIESEVGNLRNYDLSLIRDAVNTLTTIEATVGAYYEDVVPDADNKFTALYNDVVAIRSGTARAQDVVLGKTFTSMNGTNEEGIIPVNSYPYTDITGLTVNLEYSGSGNSRVNFGFSIMVPAGLYRDDTLIAFSYNNAGSAYEQGVFPMNVRTRPVIPV